MAKLIPRPNSFPLIVSRSFRIIDRPDSGEKNLPWAAKITGLPPELSFRRFRPGPRARKTVACSKPEIDIKIGR